MTCLRYLLLHTDPVCRLFRPVNALQINMSPGKHFYQGLFAGPNLFCATYRSASRAQNSEQAGIAAVNISGTGSSAETKPKTNLIEVRIFPRPTPGFAPMKPKYRNKGNAIAAGFPLRALWFVSCWSQ